MKFEFRNDNHKFIDGYDYKGAKFSVDSIIQEASYKNKIKIKIIDLEEMDNVVIKIKKTKEIYQFYINNKVYKNKKINHIDIKIDDLEDILNIF